MALRCLSKIWRPSCWHKHVTEGTNSWWAVGGHFGCIASVRGARFSLLCCWVSSAFLDVVSPWPSLARSDVLPPVETCSRIRLHHTPNGS